MPTEDLPHRTTLSGSTLEHRRPLELGDRLTLIVEAQVTGLGTKRVSDGDIEVRTLRASDILELRGGGSLTVADAIDAARTMRRAEADARTGALTLDLDAATLYLVSFETCGHDANYPEDWLRVEETGTEAVAGYFRDLERPEAGEVAPCPLCYLDNPDLEPGASSKVASVGRSEGPPPADPTGTALAELGDVDAFVAEHIPDYVDLEPAELLGRFDELPTLGLGAWQDIAAYEADVFGDEALGGPNDRDEVRADLAARIAHFSDVAPWDGYDGAWSAVIRDRLKTTAHKAREVYAYEAAHKARKAILGAAEDIFSPPPPIVDEAATEAEEERF